MSADTRGQATRPRVRGASLATRLRRAGGEQWSLAGGTATAVVYRSPQTLRVVLHGVFTPPAWEALMLRVSSERADRIELVVDPRAIMATCCRFAAEAVVRAIPARSGPCRIHIGVQVASLSWALELALLMTGAGHPMVPFVVPDDAMPASQGRAGESSRRQWLADMHVRGERAAKVLRGDLTHTREDWEEEAAHVAAALVLDRVMRSALS